jgi:hypothetical protein
MQPEYSFWTLGRRVAMQQIAPVLGRVFAHLQMPGSHVERCSGVKFSLDLGVKCAGVLLGGYAVAFSEVAFALLPGLVTPADLPPVALAVLGGRVELGAAPAVLAAWLIAGARPEARPEAHAANLRVSSPAGLPAG